MNMLINIGLFFLIIVLLFGIHSFMKTHSLVRILQCQYQELYLSVLWLYRGRKIEVFFLALAIFLRLIWNTDIWMSINISLISGFSFLVVVISRNQYRKTTLFALGVALQLFFWSVIFSFLLLIITKQFEIVSVLNPFLWFCYDFFVVLIFSKSKP